MNKQVVLVCGNIAAGKSTVMKILAGKMGWDAFYEGVTENPYLTDFYGDMGRWAFQLQMYLLGFRARQHIEASNSDQSAFIESGVYPSVWVFGKLLWKMGALSERDFESYMVMADLMLDVLPKPDQIIYLSTRPETLLVRIAKRKRPFERGITLEYLENIEAKYFAWLDKAQRVTRIVNDLLDEEQTALIIKEILKGDE